MQMICSKGQNGCSGICVLNKVGYVIEIVNEKWIPSEKH